MKNRKISKKQNLMKIFFTTGVFIFAGCAKTNFSPVKNDNTSLTDVDVIDVQEKVVDDFSIDNDAPPAKVDIIFIIDNSPSMLEEQQKLANKLSFFTDSIGTVDWQIGITTTDVSEGPRSTKGDLVDLVSTGTQSKTLTKNTPHYEKVFLNTITKNGTVPNCELTELGCGSGNEQPMKAMSMAIDKRYSSNKGFFRPNADLVTIILTDEDEDSPDPLTLISPELLTLKISQVFPGKRYTNYGIIYRPNDKSCIDTDVLGGRYGISIQKLIDMTGGISVSICDSDYSKSLEKIGKKVQKTAIHLKLSKTPNMDAGVEVILTPAQPEITWKIVGDDLELSDQPPKGTKIKVQYTKAKVSNKSGKTK